MKNVKLMVLKDELEHLTMEELSLFLFEFIKEPMAYVVGRFSDGLSLKDIQQTAVNYSERRCAKKTLLKEIDNLLQTIVMIEDPYDREILYALASAFLSLIEREHAFDAVLHDLDAIVIDMGLESSLTMIPLRIDHHLDTINRVKSDMGKKSHRETDNSVFSRLIQLRGIFILL